MRQNPGGANLFARIATLLKGFFPIRNQREVKECRPKTLCIRLCRLSTLRAKIDERGDVRNQRYAREFICVSGENRNAVLLIRALAIWLIILLW
uniref:Uncharacterized protein n=1 Tax=Candidatus Kentrum sp. DK TaxID=2126562 RepID=A0A450SBA4_9GAMM|nr:MAG: hypothetical protein BECKDK2373C_GA0170839_102613 [Candidatus Kentron sp. DK]